MQNVLGLSIGFGLLSAFGTLVSQAHGAGRPEACALWLQRGRVLATLVLLGVVRPLPHDNSTH